MAVPISWIRSSAWQTTIHLPGQGTDRHCHVHQEIKCSRKTRMVFRQTTAFPGEAENILLCNGNTTLETAGADHPSQLDQPFKAMRFCYRRNAERVPTGKCIKGNPPHVLSPLLGKWRWWCGTLLFACRTQSQSQCASRAQREF